MKKRVFKRINVKKSLIVVAVFFLAALIIFINIKINSNKEMTPSGNTVSPGSNVGGASSNIQQAQIIPLNNEESNKVREIMLSSELIKEIPEDDPIALTFFKFEGGQRIIQDSFLMGKGQLLANGDPTIYLTLHSKYISELNSKNLCEIIKKANQNKDLGFQSDYNKARLLLKYAKLIKYRGCFGF